MKRNSVPEVIIVTPEPDRIYFKFKHELGIPESNIKVFKTYYSEHFDLKNFE